LVLWQENLRSFLKAPAKLRLGIYYLRKSVFFIFLNNHITAYYTITYCLKRKNKKRFFSFQSMPNLNFAELISFLRKGGGSKTRVIILNKNGLNVMQLKLLSIIIFEGGVLCLEN